MSRVAIIGSCITRDLWPIQGEPANELLYISRTSLPSLFSPAVEGFQPAEALPNGLKRHQHQAMVNDLTKTTMAQLVTWRPTHLIFDFIDERFDLLAIGAALASHSWELETSGYLSQPALAAARPIARLGGTCDRLWMEAVGEMLALIRATPLRSAPLILHESQWATHYRAAYERFRAIENVELWGGRPADLGRHNALLDRYQAAFTALAPEAARISAPAQRIADGDHRWGLSPFHYIPEYYAEIWRQLRALGV
ncbi:MAG: DUF6270 domain-containing protein [Phenylobacterium sp.]|uniref:DUF6270 domain-containing protein n=1 Tax=Phenylobacterium sp. TaxID=1871053 RepID=UPI0027357502|nr:DUF6270 domain-containing protein [Phenylobacterium sp.]MDP3175332.1 DUF6270 domain-containing protein [Phenylobacterium sp.]